MYKANDDRYENAVVRRAGNSGLQLPALSFGMWHSFGDDANYGDSEKVILKAFDLGLFSFDLAYNYGPGSGAAERMFGEVYRANLKSYRDELVITTKAGYNLWPGPYGNFSSKKTLVNALDGSLKRMGLDYVDIYYSHRFDPNTSLEETANALDGIVRSGKALYIGISNYNAQQTLTSSLIPPRYLSVNKPSASGPYAIRALLSSCSVLINPSSSTPRLSML